VELLVLQQLHEISVAVLVDFAVRVVPLVALLALHPLLSVSHFRVTVEVDLLAEVAVLVLFIGFSAEFAQPRKGVLVKLTARPEVLFLPVTCVAADFISTAAWLLLIF